MVETVGNLLVWIAVITLLPLMTLPLAWLHGGSGRFSVARGWMAQTFVLASAGILFMHLAVDLPDTLPGFASGIWIVATLALIGVLSLLTTPSHTISRLSSVFDTITRTTGRAAMWLVFIMALVQFTSVILRYVFGINFIWVQESITYMHGAVFLLAGGYALLTDDHVRVDIFYRDAPPRRKAWVDFLGTYFFLFPFCLLLLWTATPYVGNAWAVREGSTEQSGIQGVFLLKTLIPIFALLLAMAGFVIAARAVETLKGRDS